MHISQLNNVQKLNAELADVRRQIAGLDDTGLQVVTGKGAPIYLSENTIATFTKLALIELTEKENGIIDTLGDLGVDAEPLPEACGDTCACDQAAVEAGIKAGPEALLSLLFGGPRFASGGVIGIRG